MLPSSALRRPSTHVVGRNGVYVMVGIALARMG